MLMFPLTENKIRGEMKPFPIPTIRHVIGYRCMVMQVGIRRV